MLTIQPAIARADNAKRRFTLARGLLRSTRIASAKSARKRIAIPTLCSVIVFAR